MADLLETATDWLTGVFKDDVSKQVVYRRGLAQVAIQATLGRRQLAQIDEAGIQTVYHATDFLFPAADLDFGSGPVEPETGDTITIELAGRTVTHEVLDETGGKHFEYSDPYRKYVRVHTKQTGSS